MPPVRPLGILAAAVHHRREVGREADEGLQEHPAVRGESEDGVRGAEVLAAVRDLVVLNYDEAGDQEHEGGVVEEGVRVGAGFLLRGCVRRLED